MAVKDTMIALYILPQVQVVTIAIYNALLQ